jgi:hypothetical protein
MSKRDGVRSTLELYVSARFLVLSGGIVRFYPEDEAPSYQESYAHDVDL